MRPSLATLRDPIMCLALGFGSGLWRKGPGTMGSLVGVALFLPLIDASMLIKVSLIFVGSVFGVYICEYAAKKLKLSDPGCVVWDEIVGIWIALIFVPASLAWIAFAFVCFRFFDIAKPPPLSWADRHLKGGLGIMVDDLMAGGLTALLIYVLQHSI